MDGLTATDKVMARETEKGRHGQQMEKDNGFRKNINKLGGKAKEGIANKSFLKEATVIVNLMDIRDAKVEDIIEAVTEKIGFGKLLAVRPRPDREYELTLDDEGMCDDLMDGLMIKEKMCEIRKLQTKECMVSFMHLPAYMDNKDILSKLEMWGVTPTSDIKRRYYPGTEIADGTRYLKVRFPKEVVSLPYSAKFETAEGAQYFRIMHDRQIKICRLCMDPGHVFKDCPDLKCYECEEQGHYARNCNAVKCPDCKRALVKCECWMEDEEVEGDGNQIKETETLSVEGQVWKETENSTEKEINQPERMDKEKHNNDLMDNRDNEVEQQKEKDNEGQMECDKQTSLETMQTTTEEQDKMEQTQQNLETEEDVGEEENEESKDMGKERMQRRRSIKVTPNIEVAKKKRQKKRKEFDENRFEVLRNMGEECE